MKVRRLKELLSTLNDDLEEQLLKIINHYGVNDQQRQLAEEVFELQEAITIYELKNSVQYEMPLTELLATKEHLTEECADVIVMLLQFMLYYDIDTDELNKMIDQKIKRQLERIKNE